MRWNHGCVHVIDILAATSSSHLSDIGWGIFMVCFFIGLPVAVAMKQRACTPQIAESRGWKYTKQDDSALDRFQTWPFYLGIDRHAENVATGVFEGRNVMSFDFTFRNAQSVTTFQPGPGAMAVARPPGPADKGIFAGFENALSVWGAPRRFDPRARGAADMENWGICVMEMPGTLTPVLIWLSLPSDYAYEVISGPTGIPTGADQAIPDLSMGDAEFDKGFSVRAEDPKIAAALLPKPTRDLLMENRSAMKHASIHIWTWDRYLFSLGTLPLDETTVDFRLPLMAKMIENVGP